MKAVLTITALALGLAFSGSALAEPDEQQRERLMQYLTDVGVIRTVEFLAEALRHDYEAAYTSLPPCFWETEVVDDLFVIWKTATIEAHVRVMHQELSEEEIEFLIEFHRSDDGRRAVEIANRTAPAFIDSGSEVNRIFVEAFQEIYLGAVEQAPSGESNSSQDST